MFPRKFLHFFILFSLILIISLCVKPKKEQQPDYFDHPRPKEIPPTIDLKRCIKLQEDCLEYEFFTLANFLEPNSSQKAKKAQFNRWLRHNNFTGLSIENYTVPETNLSHFRLFSSRPQGAVEFVLNDSQYIHDETYEMRYFKDTYLIYMNFQQGKMEFKAKINKIVLGLLYHSAYCIDSSFEEWLKLFPIETKALLVTLRTEELELLRNESEAYRMAKAKRKEYFNDYYDFVGLVHERWMNYHPQLVKNIFRRENVTMSDFIWARHNAEIRLIEVGEKLQKKRILLPFLEFSGIDNLVKYEKSMKISAKTSDRPKEMPLWFDNDGLLHVRFQNVGKENKTGIFFEPLFWDKPKLNYYFMLMYGIVPEENVNECLHTLLVPVEIARTIPREVFGWLIKLKFPGTSLCLHSGQSDPLTLKRLEFWGLLINLSPEEMTSLVEKYKSLEDETLTEEKRFDLAYEILPKPKILSLDYRETAYKSIDEFENKKKLNLQIIENFEKDNGSNERLDILKQYFQFYINMSDSVREIIHNSMKDYSFQVSEPKKSEL